MQAPLRAAPPRPLALLPAQGALQRAAVAPPPQAPMAPLPLELPAAPPVPALAPVPAPQRALVWALLGLRGPAWALALALPTWLAPLLWLPLRAGGADSVAVAGSAAGASSLGAWD